MDTNVGCLDGLHFDALETARRDREISRYSRDSARILGNNSKKLPSFA
jgi:hypothetical protein